MAKKGNWIKVDFTGVDVRTLIPEGDHKAKVVEVSVEEGDKGKYVKWTLAVIAEGEKWDGGKLYNNTSLTRQSLWNLRAWLIALGRDVPESPNDIDLDECLEQELMVHVEHETYEGKEKARITDFQPIDAEVTDDEKGKDEDDDDDEDDEKGKDEDDDDDEDETSLTEEQVREMDEDELVDLNKKHKLGVDFAKVTKPAKRLRLVIEALQKKKLIEVEG
jgi:TATA-binding protein-associated factor Taf7